MSRLPIIFLSITFCLTANADIPWKNIRAGNAYWAEVLGLEAATPKAITAVKTTSVVDLKPDPSIQLLNAVLRHQIDGLENKQLTRFADSMMHVMMYLSGASPASIDAQNRAGWWKLSYPVAMRYGLEINNQIDERYDFEKSTKVAMRYCQDLKNDHGEKWLLAFVRSPLESNRDESGKKKDELQNDLLIVYNLMVTSNYSAAEEYAVNQFYNNIEAYKVDRTLLKELIYEQTGIQASAFSALNPSLSGTLIPNGSKVYLTDLALENLKKNMEDIVLLSEWRMEESAEKLELARNRIVKNQPDPRTSTANYYKVRSGDNLGVIASRYGVKVSDIKSWNSLRGNTIYVGQKLVVYSSKSRQPKTVTASTSTKSSKAAKQKPASLSEGSFLTYKVRSGDTLYSIAQRFPGVSADNLMAWNGISSSIKVGQKIKVLKSEIRDYSTDKYPDSI